MWHNVQLNEIVSVHGGKRLPSGHDYAEHDTSYKYLRVTDFFQRTPSVRELNSLNKETFDALRRYEIKNGDLYISIAGSIGLVGEWNQSGKYEVILTENAARLSPISEFCSGFLAKQLNSDDVQQQIGVEIGTGGGVPKLALFRIEKLKIKLPDIATQIKVNSILDCVDHTIEKTEELITKYERIKQGMMHDLFTRGVDENGKLRPSSEDAPELYQETDLGVIPKEWKTVFLGAPDYFDIQTGGTPSTEIEAFWKNGSVPWMESGEVHKKVLYDTNRTITELGFNSSNAKFYPVHTVLIALAGQGKTRGTVAISEIELTSNQSIAGIISHQDKVEPYFLFYILGSQYEELRAASAGAGRAGLSKTILSQYKIVLPSKPEQIEIAKRLKSIDLKINTEKAMLEKTKLHKAGLMQDLLTGKVSVNVEKKEAA